MSDTFKIDISSSDSEYEFESGSEDGFDVPEIIKISDSLFNSDVKGTLLLQNCVAHCHDNLKINYTFSISPECENILGLIGKEKTIRIGALFTRKLEEGDNIPKIEISTPILHKNPVLSLINNMVEIIWYSDDEAISKIQQRISDLTEKKVDITELNKGSEKVIKSIVSKDVDVMKIYTSVKEVCWDSHLAVRIFKAIKYGLECINHRCYVCNRGFDNPVEYPMICHYQLCRFTASEMFGIHDLPTYLKEKKHLVDFYVNLVVHAARSNRRDTIFTHVPIDIKLDDGTVDYEKIINILELYSKIDIEYILVLKDDDKILDYLKEIHISLHKTIWWVICAIHYNLKEIDEDTFLSETRKIVPGDLKAYTIFKLVDNYTPKEKVYQSLRKEKDSHHAFHGSRMENWFSILKNGLINASNTKMMTTGAAYGTGIYLASNITTSLGYCGNGYGVASKGTTTSIQYICGVVEVADTSHFGKNTGGIMTIPDADYVTIKYLLVKYQ